MIVTGEDKGTRADAHTLSAVERMVRLVLLAGIALSVALMAVGISLLVVRGEALPGGVTPVSDLGHGLVSLQAAAYLSLGLIVLIATPFVRVAGSIVAFARERDARYVLVTSVVLVVMCLSVLLGKA